MAIGSMSRRVGGCVAGAVMAACCVAVVGCDEPNKDKPVVKADGTGKTDGKSDEKNGTKAAAPKIEEVTIDGKTFKLELALDDKTRFHGLSDRTSIDADGGMLFVFPRAQTLSFVMRDCPVDIDIIYLDSTGRVVNKYKMKSETPRGEGETVLDSDNGTTNKKYEARLKKYTSGYDAQFVIELKGGTLDTLKVETGDKIKLDLVRLKRLPK